MASYIGTKYTDWRGTMGRYPETQCLNHNAAYTVLFRFYLPSQPAYDTLWAIGNTTGSAVDRSEDRLKFSSGGNIDLWQFNGGSLLDDSLVHTTLAAGWHTVAVVRVDTTHLKARFRVGTGTPATINCAVVDITGRQATYEECLLGDQTADNCSANIGVTNYKCWQRALSDAEIDAEDLTTAVTAATSLLSVSPMGDEVIQANNCLQTGSLGAWWNGDGLTAGSNDPAVSYASSGFIPRRTLLGVG